MIRIALVAAACLFAACTQAPAPRAEEPKPSAGAPAAGEPFKIASVFPPGPGQEKVLETCGTCHSLLCATKGQRNGERWDAVKTSHKDKMTGASNADLDAMFKYLAAHFNESKPEPAVPAELMQQGCTPF